MRIDGNMPSSYAYYMPRAEAVRPVTASAGADIQKTPAAQGGPFGPAAVLEISPEGRAAYEASIGGSRDIKTECQTCANRTYVDQSDDPSVSFQTPTKISPEAAPALVAAHEGEHVAHEQARAAKEGKRVVSQSVTIHTSVCPECGKVYVSGGETRTVTATDNKPEQKAADKPAA